MTSNDSNAKENLNICVEKLNISLIRNYMKDNTYIRHIFIGIAVLFMFACNPKELNKELPQIHTNFDFNTLLVKENNGIAKVRGQVLYLPIYSNVPYLEHGRSHDLSAFVAIHNTDLQHTMTITKVLFFDNDGKIVSSYLSKDSVLQPLGATNFFVPEKDKSGTGANFIVEWVADTLINEPLIESVMLSLTSGQGLSFSSKGRIIRESK